MAWSNKEPKTYYDLKGCNKRISIHQGGSSSGKSYSILKGLIGLAYKNKDKGAIISIVRKTLPAIKKSIYRDLKNILAADNIPYKENRTELTFDIYGNTFEMIGLDDSQKARGPRRDVLFCNEANELTWEDFRQLNMRTKVKTIIDFNPSSEFWAHTELQNRSDAGFYKSNYTHNPFLDPFIRKEIERYRDTDPNFWRVYGRGELGFIEGVIYSNWEQTNEFPEDCKNIKYGLDFGYTNNPTALIKIGEKEGRLYCQELLYTTQLTNQDIILRLKDLEINPIDQIIADSAEPKSIEEIYRGGFNIHPTVKGADSVINGINKVKQKKLIVTKDSLNLIKELRNYKWQQDKEGKYINKPVKAFDHLLDALRYCTTFDVPTPSAWMV